MGEPKVTYSEQDHTAIIALNRPKKKNAIDLETIMAINESTDKANANSEIRSVIVTGNGGAFCSGADLTSFEGDSTSVERLLMEGYFVGLHRLLTMEKPVICAVEGPAAGIGCAYLLASDVVVMAEDSFFSLAFSNIGLIPDGGINWLLTRAIGHQKSFRLAAEATRVKAKECLELGICSEVAPPGKALEHAQKLGQLYASRAPLSLGRAKKLLYYAQTQTYEESFSLEAQFQAELVGSADNREGIRAFMEKRAPKFIGK